jgi:prepilin-type processing-associated H-X9-DG protein
VSAGRSNCSWVDGHGNRLFGTFLRWDSADSNYAIVRMRVGTCRARIYRANLTFEVG